jgi:pimeloyl-ACP methyl ester carboxylesterase
MPKLHIGPRTLHYLQMGRGPGVVMIHGLGTNQACWQLKVAPRLVAEFQEDSPVSREMVAFEWLRRAGTKIFREINREFLR